jgi:hypothetical protein
MSALALFVSLGGVGYAAVTIGSPQIMNNSVASKDIKNRTIVSKDISKKTVASLKGKKGDTGPQGSAGPTASSVASANPGSAINPVSFSPLLSTTVTTTTSSRVIGNASIQVEPAFGTPLVACQITIDGGFVGQYEQTSLSTPFVVISMSQGTVVPAGSHTVAIACQQTAASSGALFARGNITAIAAAA